MIPLFPCLPSTTCWHALCLSQSLTWSLNRPIWQSYSSSYGKSSSLTLDLLSSYVLVSTLVEDNLFKSLHPSYCVQSFISFYKKIFFFALSSMFKPFLKLLRQLRDSLVNWVFVLNFKHNYMILKSFECFGIFSSN